MFKSKKNAQDAHEAIRPSDPALTPDSIKKSLSAEPGCLLLKCRSDERRRGGFAAHPLLDRPYQILGIVEHCYNLTGALFVDMTKENRVTFNEITKTGVKYGMEHPRVIDTKLVDAQQARRILDRIVGYKISPFLWRKVRRA